MNHISHEEYKSNIFMENPEINELYQKEALNYIISKQIKEIRERKRMSQFELAKKIWMTQSVIARIESGTSNISMKTLWKILLGLDAKIKIS